MKIYHPIVHKPHSMRFEHLERNVFIIVMIFLLAMTAFAVYRIETRERERDRIQHEQEAAKRPGGVEINP